MLRLAAILLILLATQPAKAEVAYHEPGDVVAGRPDITYFDLLKPLFTNLEVKNGNLSGSPVQNLRHVAGADEGDQPPEQAPYFSISSAILRAGGQDRLALMVDLGVASEGAQGYAILALYSLDTPPKLLDAANVALDRMTSFHGVLELGDSESALIVGSTHFNSNQGYKIDLPILVRGDRLEMIDMIFTFDERMCSYERMQQLQFKALPDGAPFRTIEATVTDTTVPAPEQCSGEPKAEPAAQTITVRYAWDAARSKYVPDSDAFDRLAAENAERH